MKRLLAVGRGVSPAFGSLFPLLALLLMLPASTPAQNLSGPTTLHIGTAATTSRFWVKLHSHAQLEPAYGITDFAARGQYVVDELQRDARATQGPFISFLKQHNAKYQSFWITNSVLVEADDVTRSLIAHLPEVELIEPDVPLKLDPPVASVTLAGAPVGGVEWNVKRTHAPEVWSQYGAKGQGVVVGIIDTGALTTHPALKDHYRGYRGSATPDHNHNWYNTVDNECKTAPCDGHGHGTHVTGTILGNTGNFDIGVAPGAKFISCKALNAYGSGTWAGVVSCYQWMMAPTDVNGNSPSTALRPQVVNASLGGGYQASLVDISNSLRAEGILSVAAAGNDGGCGKVGYPAGASSVLAVGALAYDSTTVATFSSGGPAANNSGIKPDVMAGGQNVTSAWNNGQYNTISGTSMASPAVAGVAALVISAAPHWKDHPAALAQLLRDTATKLTGTGRSCNTNSSSPNMIFGYGEVDALAAAKKAFTSNPSP